MFRENNILITGRDYNNRSFMILNHPDGSISGKLFAKKENIIADIPIRICMGNEFRTIFKFEKGTIEEKREFLKQFKWNILENSIDLMPRLKGGGLGGVLLGVSQIAVGVVLITTTGPVGGIIASGFIGSGINGTLYGASQETCDPGEYIKQSAIGAVTGMTTGGVNVGVNSLTAKIGTKITEKVAEKAATEIGKKAISKTVEVAIKGANSAICGASGQVISVATEATIRDDSRILTDKLTSKKILAGAIAGVVSGAVNGAFTNNLTQEVTDELTDKIQESAIRETMREVFKGSVTGGITGASTTIVINALEGKEDISEGVAESLTVGAVIGGVTSAAYTTKVLRRKKAQHNKSRQKIEENLEEFTSKGKIETDGTPVINKLLIEIEQSSNAKDVRELSVLPDEDERLFGAGSTFKKISY